MTFQSPEERHTPLHIALQIRVVDCGKAGREMVNCGWGGPVLDLMGGSSTYS